MDESDVGILYYFSQLPGFRGILMQRYSDFIVNEVDFKGNVVHLTSLEGTAELVEEKEVMASNRPNTTYDAEIDSFRALAGEDDAGLLKALVDEILSGVKVDIEPVLIALSKF